MPILKPISGHGSTGGIRRYLEKGGRALARDLFNLSYDERDAGALGEDAKEACAWDAEMDATRAAFGTDAPWRGKPARTFKHFVLSPDPGDDIDLAALRELACSWALKHFGNHEIAIVYHDDNARGIPHAHIVVNNANLRTGYRMQTQHPEDLNRDLQDMARERGLSGLSNDRAPESPSKARGHAGAGGPRSRRSVYLGRAEKEIMRSGGYSWVGDIRARVALAKTTARDEAEFLGILDALGVHVADNSAKARRDDWVFSLAEEPSKKVSGERLGFVYGKEMLRRRFEREGAYRPTDASTARIREAADSYYHAKVIECFALLASSIPERVTAADAVRISDRDCVECICSYINSNLSSDLSTKTLCDIAHVSEGKMISAFRNAQGDTPQSYIRAQRLEYGRRLLLDGSRKIGEIAKSAGYRNQGAFTDAFKRAYGTTPRAYRKRLRIE